MSSAVSNQVRVTLVFSALLTSHFSASCLVAQEASRIIDEEPFDRLVLKDGKSVRLQPLKGKRRPLQALPEALTVRLLENPLQAYQVASDAVAKLELFEQLVLAEAATLVEQKRFDDAYDYYRFLERQSADFPGVREAFEQCLFREAGHWQRVGRPDQALVLLDQLHRRNAKFEHLDRAMGAVVNLLVDERLKARQYSAARQLVDQLAARFPRHAVVTSRRREFAEGAATALATAHQAMERQSMRAAYEAVRGALDQQPDLEDARSLLAQLAELYPVVHVGVREFPGPSSESRPPSWPARRQQRLTGRLLFEAVVSGSPAVVDTSVIVDAARSGASLTLTVRDGVQWSSEGERLSAADLATAIHAAPGSELIESVRVVDANRLDLRFATLPARPEALFRVALRPWKLAAERAIPTGLSPYQRQESAEGEARFQINLDYFAAAPRQPREVIERRFGLIQQAVAALVQGEIQLIDRIHPGELAAVKSREEIVVIPYAVPTVHLLVPNGLRTRMSRVELRRAIHHGLLRQRVLEELGVTSPALGRPLDRPFPVAGDSPPAAGDDSPRADSHDPRLMLELAAADRASIEAAPLRIAHGPSELARRVCRMIAEQLSLEGKGIATETWEYSDRESLADRPWDLLFVEWCVTDVASEARAALSSPEHPTAGDAWLDRLLARLERASSIVERQAAEDAIAEHVRQQWCVIPLWQLASHAARHKSVEDVGERLVTLYDHVESWTYHAEPK